MSARQQQKHIASGKGLRSLYDHLYVPVGHTAWDTKTNGRLKSLMKQQEAKKEEAQRQSCLKEKLSEQADAMRVAKHQEV